MHQPNPTEPATRTRVTLAASQLKEVEDLYTAGLMIQACEAALRAGPLEAWESPAAKIMAARIARNVGAPSLARSLIRLAFREQPKDPQAIYYRSAEIMERRGPFAAWEFTRAFGRLEAQILSPASTGSATSQKSPAASAISTPQTRSSPRPPKSPNPLPGITSSKRASSKPRTAMKNPCRPQGNPWQRTPGIVPAFRASPISSRFSIATTRRSSCSPRRHKKSKTVPSSGNLPPFNLISISMTRPGNPSHKSRASCHSWNPPSPRPSLICARKSRTAAATSPRRSSSPGIRATSSCPTSPIVSPPLLPMRNAWYCTFPSFDSTT